MFFVDTRAATAVDMGCSYELEVDDSGEGLLAVKGGWVELDGDAHDAQVPAGAVCRIRRGQGPGTPHFPMRRPSS